VPVEKESPPKETEKPKEKEKSEPPPTIAKESKAESKKSEKPAEKDAVAAFPMGSRGETRVRSKKGDIQQRNSLCTPQVKMNRMRLRIAERLKESQNAAASLTTFNEIDMSSLIDMRNRYKDSVLKEQDVKLGFMSAFARACTLALKEIPAANASIEGDEIVYRDYVDLSVAVATPKGLVTPVVRNVETMGFVEIEKEIAALGKKVRAVGVFVSFNMTFFLCGIG